MSLCPGNGPYASDTDCLTKETLLRPVLALITLEHGLAPPPKHNQFLNLALCA